MYNPCIGFDKNGTVYFTITEQMTAASGSGVCCLELKTDDGLKYTKNVPIYISKNPVNNNNIESTDEYKTIFDIYEEILKMGAIITENKDAIQSVYDNIDTIKQVPQLSEQVQQTALQVESDKTEIDTMKGSIESTYNNAVQIESNVQQIQTSINETKASVETSEENAKQSEINAKNSENQSAQNAQNVLENKEYVESVMPEIRNAADNATLSKSWAVGGTGSREGEDVNNSKYWAEQAMAVSNGYLGYFDTPELLQQAHPTGQKGDWAIVDSTGSMWYWSATENKFSDSLDGVNLSDYYTKEQSDTIFAKKEDIGNVVKTLVFTVQQSSWTQENGIYSASFQFDGCTESSKIISININKINSDQITLEDLDNFSNLFEYAETQNGKIVLFANTNSNISMSVICSIID